MSQLVPAARDKDRDLAVVQGWKPTPAPWGPACEWHEQDWVTAGHHMGASTQQGLPQEGGEKKEEDKARGAEQEPGVGSPLQPEGLGTSPPAPPAPWGHRHGQPPGRSGQGRAVLPELIFTSRGGRQRSYGGGD